jgi:microcystin-dependent protein
MARTTTTSAPQQGVNMPAVDLRQMFGTLIAVAGIRTSSDLQVVQRGAGANMSVDVGAGSCALADGHAGGSAGGFYAYTLAATTNFVVATADATNPRIDRIVVTLTDQFQGDVSNTIGVSVLAGTPTTGATLINLSGAQAVPATALLLANVLVPAASSSVVTANIQNLATVIQAAGAVPSGAILPYGGTSAPAGFLLCDGSAISRTTYAALFTACSTAFGAGDASTTFNLPDGRGRVLVGYTASGGHADVNAIGNNEGGSGTSSTIALNARRPKHLHTVNESAHFHTVASSGVAGPAGVNGVAAGAGINTSSDKTNLTVGPQTSSPSDAPAYVTANYIIKT